MILNNSLRKWQLIAWNEFKKNLYKGIIEVATGGGKTIFALYAFQELLKKNIDLKMLVVVPTTALQDQWFVNFREDFGLSEDNIAFLNSRSNDRDLKLVNIIVINSARELKISDKIRESVFLVVDECHRAGSDENAKALVGSWQFTLGLSATPERQYDEGTAKYLVPALGTLIYSYSVEEALADGVLVPFQLLNVEVPLMPEERAEIDSLTKSIARAMNNFDAEIQVEALLRRRARAYNNARYRVPVTVKIMESHRGDRTMIFHESIKAAEEITELLVEAGHSAAVYHSKISDARRRENLRLFRIGVIDVLVTCRALDEGANMPETRVAIIAAATSSNRQRIQRLGRVLRPHPSKKFSSVYSLFATKFEKARLEKEVERMSGLAEVSWLKVEDGN